GGEVPWLDRLHHQHPLDCTRLDQRHAQEGVVGIFAGLGEVLEARVLKGVGHHDGGHLFRDQARQSLVKAHAHTTDTVLPEAQGSAQDQLPLFVLQEVDRADVGVKASLDELHNVGQRLAWIVAVRDELADLLQRQEQRTFLSGRCGHVDGPKGRPSVARVAVPGKVSVFLNRLSPGGTTRVWSSPQGPAAAGFADAAGADGCCPGRSYGSFAGPDTRPPMTTPADRSALPSRSA